MQTPRRSYKFLDYYSYEKKLDALFAETEMSWRICMSDDRHRFKPKKSVALSGVVAGNTALCTVGQTGNDLHYRGYDILDIAERRQFEEVAHFSFTVSCPMHRNLPLTKPN